mmetsp:Transcript_21827/g.51774  ORF Transcript_21827/g.51774 Transcript_21827/m.51774 type:complete len:149 (+) Transcript_21827:103-549(+)
MPLLRWSPQTPSASMTIGNGDLFNYLFSRRSQKILVFVQNLTCCIGLFLSPTPSLRSLCTDISLDTMSGAASRIINSNKRLFGPGPVARVPVAGINGYYARLAPLEGFTHAAVHGTVLGFIAAAVYKFGVGDPEAKEIAAYYEENPPR